MARCCIGAGGENPRSDSSPGWIKVGSDVTTVRIGGQLVEVAGARAECYKSFMAQLSPLVSEFATTEEAEAHDRWFRAKVQASLADGRPIVPHDEVMAEARRIIEAEARAKTPE